MSFFLHFLHTDALTPKFLNYVIHILPYLTDVSLGAVYLLVQLFEIL